MAQGWTDARSAAGKHSPWLIVGVISLATFMEVLDTSIANVSLTHIAGGLSVSQDESTWVITSYLVSNAVIVPISGWLSDTIGRKRYYMISVALFGLSSLLCGMSSSLAMLVAARIIQGIGGGGLAPSEQSILADTFPPEKRGMAFAAYGVVVVCGPVLGPTLGGAITDAVSWHWIFLINVPVAVISLLLVHFFVDEPKAVRDARAKMLKRGLRVDYVGFLLVMLGLGCLEITLDRGERAEWFSSGLIVTTTIISALSLTLLIFWELARKDPIVNIRLLANRNFAICSLFMMTAGLIIFGTTQIVPQMLQQVFGYTATDAGMAMTTGGLATLIAMPVCGMLIGRIDTRIMLFGTLLVQGTALMVYSGFSTDISYGHVAATRLIQAVGLPFLFVPVNAVAFVGIPQERTADASALLNVSRNLGGTIGISTAQTLLAHRMQFHQARLTETLNPLTQSYTDGLNAVGQLLSSAASDTTEQLGVLYQQIQQQATMLAYVDVFRAFMWFIFALAPLALVLKPARGAAPGGH